MKKGVPFYFTAALCAALFCGCDRVEDMGSLQSLSRPYEGEYLCRSLCLNGEECVNRFAFLGLTLEDGGKFTLVCRAEGGGGRTVCGNYSVNGDGSAITFTAGEGEREKHCVFPMREGAIYIDFPLGAAFLHAEFALP